MASAVRILLIDNYDSFTHNLAQVLGGLGADVEVVRHDVPASQALRRAPDRVVLSPGPGGPAESGCCAEVLRLAAGRIPVLGVCLGMQVIAWALGASVRRSPAPVHGRSTPLRHDGRGLFRGLPQDLPAGRYHSLAVDPRTLPAELAPTAWSEGVLMGLRHRLLPVEGIQFHPESVLTPSGAAILAAFLDPSCAPR